MTHSTDVTRLFLWHRAPRTTGRSPLSTFAQSVRPSTQCDKKGTGVSPSSQRRRHSNPKPVFHRSTFLTQRNNPWKRTQRFAPLVPSPATTMAPVLPPTVSKVHTRRPQACHQTRGVLTAHFSGRLPLTRSLVLLAGFGINTRYHKVHALEEKTRG